MLRCTTHSNTPGSKKNVVSYWGRILWNRPQPNHSTRIIDRYITGTRLRLRRIESPSGEVLVEIEAQSGVEISSLPVPEFATREVTGDQMFSGGKLVELLKTDFQSWMATW